MNTPPSSKTALRRLLLFVVLGAALVIFSYGWTATDIDLAVPQEPQRQQNVGNALRELLSPNVFTQEYEVLIATTQFGIDCPEAFIPSPVPDETLPYIVIEPTCGSSGDTVTVSGFNFAANGLARVNWVATDGERRIRQAVGVNADNFTTNGDGRFSVQIEVPRIRGTSGEVHTIEVQGRFPVGLPTISNTTSLVLEKMLETIFLALIATAVSILPSAILSFFAAHNLMRPIRAQLGGMLLSVALLPLGWLLGVTLLGQLGTVALNIGRGGDALGMASASVLFIGAVASTRRGGAVALSPTLWRTLLNVVLLAVVSTALIGLIGGLGLLFEQVFTEGLIGYVASFIGSLGEMIALAMLPISGIIGVVATTSIGTRLTRDMFKYLSAPWTYVLGGVLGAFSGAILLGMTASIGTVAAWLGLLTPFAAASLSSAAIRALYRRIRPLVGVPSTLNRVGVSALGWLGSIIGFVTVFVLLNVRQALVEGVLPPADVAFELFGLSVSVYVAQAMLLGALLGGLAGGLAGTKANFPIGTTLYNFTRTLLNGLRSIEPLIMGLVFVIWVGIGPFAGVLALALHSIASLGKLYSEQIENIDAGPIEAIQSTGANQLQTIMYAVVPQVIPPYIAFTMYRWDINVRMSTIIGFVGGGGIGFLLQQQINLLRYRDAGVAVLAIAIVVSILDYASATIRERYI